MLQAQLLRLQGGSSSSLRHSVDSASSTSMQSGLGLSVPEPFRASIVPSLPPSKWSAPVTPPSSVSGAAADNSFYARSPPPPRATSALSAPPPPPQYRFGSETLSTVVLPSPLSAASTSSQHSRCKRCAACFCTYIHSIDSALGRSHALAAVNGKLSEHSTSPLNGSASYAASFAHSPMQASSSSTYASPSGRQYLNPQTYSSPSSASSSVYQQQHTSPSSAAPALGRSLPSSSALHQPLPVPTSRLPIRPVGPPPSQQLLSLSGGSGDSTQFQSLVQV